jgi:hypothetical protein
MLRLGEVPEFSEYTIVDLKVALLLNSLFSFIRYVYVL